MLENEITGNFISNALRRLENNGWLEKNRNNDLLKKYEYNGIANDMKLDGGAAQRRFFVRRLRHLQHICQTFEGQLSDNANVIGEHGFSFYEALVVLFLLTHLGLFTRCLSVFAFFTASNSGSLWRFT